MHFLQELGLTQNDLALRLEHRGVTLSRKSISAWERGQRQPHLSQSEQEALAGALRWEMATLADEMRDSK